MKRLDWRQYDADVVGVGLVLAVVVLGYGFVVHRPLMDALRHGSVSRRHAEAVKTVRSLRDRCAQEQEEIGTTKEHLARAQLALYAPGAVDKLLEQLDEIASACGVVVSRWQPMGTEKHAEYQIGTFVVTGSGGFPALHRWLAGVEKGIQYLDVTHFSIQGSKEMKDPCQFECTMRFYSAPAPSESGQVALARPS